MPAYEQLVRDHHALVYRLSLGVLRDSAAAEDAAQDVFLDLLRRPGALDGVDNPRAFVARMAVNRALKARRGGERREKRESAAARKEAGVDPVEAAFRGEVRDAVRALPEEERLAVDLRYFQEFSLEEAAVALEVSPRTVTNRISEALARLRRALAGAAFVALLAKLESELTACGAEPVPAGLEKRLRELHVRGAATTGSARLKGVAAVIAALVLVAVGVMRWAGDRPATKSAEVSRGKPESFSSGGAPATGPARTSAAPGGWTEFLDLTGAVRDEDGKAVKGARVEAVRYPWRRINLPFTSVPRVDETAGPSATSDAAGAFTLPLPRGVAFNIRVTAPGFARLELPLCSGGNRLEVALRPGVRLSVRVTGEDGKAFQGERVEVEAIFEEFKSSMVIYRAAGVPDSEFLRAATTDERGDAVFEDLPGGISVRVRTQPAGFCPAGEAVDLPLTGETSLSLVANPGVLLKGVVRDNATGEGIPGARVTQFHFRPATTDGEGRFGLTVDPERGLSLVAEAEGYAFRTSIVGQGREAEIHLRRGREIRGRCVRPDGTPVADTPVALVDAAEDNRTPESRFFSRTGPDGTFRFPSPAHDHAQVLLVLAEGLARRHQDIAASAGAEPLDLGDVLLAAPRRLEGRVLTADGTPLPRRRVMIQGGEPGWTGDMERWNPFEFLHGRCAGAVETILTDAGGKFRFADLPAGPYKVRTWADDGVEHAVSVELPAGRDVLDVEIREAGRRDLVVHVVDETGAAVENARVQVSGKSGMLKGVTDASGQAFVSVTDADVSVSAHSQKGTKPLFMYNLDVQAGPADREVTVAVRSAATISGVVVEAEGADGMDTMIEARTGDMSTGMGIEDGTFELLLPTGVEADLSLRLMIQPDSEGPEGLRRMVETTVELGRFKAGTSGLRFTAPRIPRDGTLRVFVLGPDGAAAAGARVDLSTGFEGAARSAATDSSGLAEFKGLPVIPWIVEAHPAVADESVLLGRREGVSTGGERVELRLRRAAPVSGQVVGPDGTPAAKAYLFSDIEGAGRKGVSAAEDGTFRIHLPSDGLAPLALEAYSHDGKFRGRLEGIAAGATGLVLRLEAVK